MSNEASEVAADALRGIARSLANTNDDRLPPERVLAQQLGVSRGLVRRLLQQLADEGLVVSKPQSAWRASGRSISEPSQTLVSFTEMATMYGYVPHTEVLSTTTRLASADESRQLRLQELDPVFELVRRRHLDTRPVSVETVVLPISLAGDLPSRDLTDRSLFVELAANGVEVRRTDAVVEAAAAPAHVSSLLGIQERSPVLLQQESSFDSIGRPLFLGQAYYRADSYRFRSTLWRKPQATPAIPPGPVLTTLPAERS